MTGRDGRSVVFTEDGRARGDGHQPRRCVCANPVCLCWQYAPACRCDTRRRCPDCGQPVPIRPYVSPSSSGIPLTESHLRTRIAELEREVYRLQRRCWTAEGHPPADVARFTGLFLSHLGSR